MTRRILAQLLGLDVGKVDAYTNDEDARRTTYMVDAALTPRDVELLCRNGLTKIEGGSGWGGQGCVQKSVLKLEFEHG